MKRFYQLVAISGFILVILSVLPLFAFWRGFEESIGTSFNSTIIMSTVVLFLELLLYSGFVVLGKVNKNKLLYYSSVFLIFFSLCNFCLLFTSKLIHDGGIIYVISQTIDFSLVILIALIGFSLMDFVNKLGSSAIVTGILYMITGVVFFIFALMPGLSIDGVIKFFFMLIKLTLAVLTNVFVGIFFLYISRQKRLRRQ